MSTPIEPTSSQRDGRSRLILLGGLALILLAAAFLFTFRPASTIQDPASLPEAQAPVERIQLPTSGGPLQVGDLPYEFSLIDLEGNSVRLSEFIGRPVLVNFWATWCGPCRIEMPELQAAYEAYQDKGLVILALDQDETAEAVDSFFEEFGLTFTPLLDDGKQVANLYGTFGALPSSYFINPDGEITAIHRGPMVREQIEAYLAQTIPGQG